MGHRVHGVNKLQQYPDCKNHPLIRLAVGIQPQIIASAHIRDPQGPLQITQDFLCCLRRLIPQQTDDLCFRQSPILGQPLDHTLFLRQQH